MYNQLLMELQGVQSLQEFHDVLQNDETFGEFYSSDLLKIPAIPVGGSKESWKTDEGYNNRFATNVNEDPMSALIERTTNSHDAVSERWMVQGLFNPIPHSAEQAMEQTSADTSSANGGVYFFVDDNKNVQIIDTGIGVKNQDFGRTLMAIGGKGKQNKDYVIGGYGFGAASTYRFADMTLIVTRSLSEPNIVTFAPVFRIHRKGFTDPSYVYMVAPNGDFLTADASLFSANDHFRITDLKSVRNHENEFHKILKNKLVLGDCGTSIRIVGFKWPPSTFSSKINIYTSLRERLFGIQNTTHFFYVRGGNSDGYDGVKGLRYYLNSKRTIGSTELLFAQKPHGIMTEKGQSKAKISAWVINWRRDAEGNYIKPSGNDTNRNMPISSVLTRSKWQTPLFITRNGQTHKCLPIYVRLKHAELKDLNGKIIIEINLDNMSAIERCDFLTSTREGITKDALDKINDEIEKYLKEDTDDLGNPGVLTRLAAKIREDDFRNHKPEEIQVDTAGIQKLLTSIGGGIFDLYGGKMNPNTNNKPGDTSGDNSGGGGGGGGGGDRAPVVLHDPPTFMNAVKKQTIQIGKDEYFSIRSDAAPSCADLFLIDLSEAPFLIHSSESFNKGLTEGREAWRLHCLAETPVGTTGKVKVTLLRDEGDLVVEWEIRAIEPNKASKETEQQKMRSAIPEPNFNYLDSTDNAWSNLEPGNLKEAEIAFSYDFNKAGNSVNIYVNSQFGPLVRAQKMLKRDDNASDLKDEYSKSIWIAVLSYLDGGLEAEDGENAAFTIETLHRSKAAAAKMSLMHAIKSLDEKRIREFGTKRMTLKAESRMEEAMDFED